MEDRLRADGWNVLMIENEDDRSMRVKACATTLSEYDWKKMEATWVAGRSNRLRRMDAEGLKEGIGCMPMETK